MQPADVVRVGVALLAAAVPDVRPAQPQATVAWRDQVRAEGPEVGKDARAIGDAAPGERRGQPRVGAQHLVALVPLVQRDVRLLAGERLPGGDGVTGPATPRRGRRGHRRGSSRRPAPRGAAPAWACGPRASLAGSRSSIEAIRQPGPTPRSRRSTAATCRNSPAVSGSSGWPVLAGRVLAGCSAGLRLVRSAHLVPPRLCSAIPPWSRTVITLRVDLLIQPHRSPITKRRRCRGAACGGHGARATEDGRAGRLRPGPDPDRLPAAILAAWAELARETGVRDRPGLRHPAAGHQAGRRGWPAGSRPASATRRRPATGGTTCSWPRTDHAAARRGRGPRWPSGAPASRPSSSPRNTRSRSGPA